MRIRTMALAIAAGTGLLITGAVAQHEEHHPDQTAPPADKADAGKKGGMMSGEMMSQMMSQMPPMMVGQYDTAKLVDQLTTSFAAIEAEKNPTARKKKLAAFRVSLKELQAKVQAQSHMMDMMPHMMAGSMTDGKTTGGAATDEHKH
jgi:hypothetical protein